MVMIKKLVASLMLALSCYIAAAVSLTVTFCPSTDSSVTGYRLYYSVTNKITGWTPTVYANGTNCPSGNVLTNGTNWLRSYQTNVNIGRTNYFTISNAVVGKTYYMAVVAYDTNGIQSLLSNEAEKTVTNFPPSAPVNLQIIDIK
jgi:hypothetical protein